MRRLIALLTVVAAASATPVRAEDSPLSQGDRDAFAWFDKLGYPDTSKLAPVRIPSREARRELGPSRYEKSFALGFLVKEGPDSFTAFLPDLGTYDVKKLPAAQKKANDYEPADLEKEAKKVLADLEKRDEHLGDGEDPGYRYWSRVQTFVLARACAARGLEQAAHDLCQRAAAMGPTHGDMSVKKPLLDWLKIEIAYKRIWKCFLDANEVSVSRKELVREFTDFVALFPEDEHVKLARETGDLLAQMVAEDEAHVAPKKPLAELPVKERVAELIWRLRDQPGYQWSDPGSCDFFYGRWSKAEGAENTTAEQLVAIGYDAVPQLIESLEDKRYTRGVGQHRSFYFSHYILRIGDCALQILERIAGQRFYETRSTSGAMVKDGDAATVKARIQKWWDEFSAKGEEAYLVEGTVAGNTELAERLIARYPAKALDVLLRAIRSESESGKRAGLIQVIATIPGDGPIAVLEEEARRGSELSSKVAAARELWRRGKREVVDLMIGEWERLDPSVRDLGWPSDSTILGFLVGTGEPKAIEVLGKNWKKRRVELRFELVQSLGYARFEGDAVAPITTEQRVASRVAAEKVLVAALDDADERTGLSSSWGNGKSMSDPRICDLAGAALAQGWKGKYSYDPTATIEERDRARVVAANVWRAEHGEKPLDVPKAVKIEALPESKTTPLIDKVVSGKEDERDGAIEDLTALGLPALAAVQKRAAALEAGPPRARLEALARTLSTIVRDVAIAPGSEKPKDEVATALAVAKGRPLTKQRFRAVLDAFMKSQPGGDGSIKLAATRAGDGTGVVLRIELGAGTGKARAKDYDFWNTSEEVTLRGVGLTGSFGSASVKNADTNFSSLSALETALAAPLDAPFEARITLYSTGGK